MFDPYDHSACWFPLIFYFGDNILFFISSFQVMQKARFSLHVPPSGKRDMAKSTGLGRKGNVRASGCMVFVSSGWATSHGPSTGQSSSSIKSTWTMSHSHWTVWRSSYTTEQWQVKTISLYPPTTTILTLSSTGNLST